MSLKTLVTGGAGFIGSNIAKALLEQGHRVIVYDNLSTGYRSNLLPQCEFIAGDIRDQELLKQSMHGVDVVFHLAAAVGNTRSIEQPLFDSEVNLLGTIRILEAVRNAGVSKVVYSSSAGIFGELKSLPINEDHPVMPDSPYGVSKLAAEKMCLAYSRLYGFQAICLRYFNVYGINQRYDAYGNVIPIFATQLLSGEPLRVFGDGNQTRDFVNVRDVARANLLAAQTDAASTAINIASGSALTINNLIQLMGYAHGAKPTVEYCPPRKGDVYHSCADVGVAKSIVGYEPTVQIEEGLLEYLQWFKAELSLVEH